MAKKDPKLLAKLIVELLGGEENISSYTNCWTRFRVDYVDKELINEAELKAHEHIMGIVWVGQQIQLVLGPGFVDKVRTEVGNQFPNINSSKSLDEELDKNNGDLASIAAANKAELKAGHTSGLQQFFQKFSNIFTPLIFGFIGVGIMAGIGGIIQSFFTENVQLEDGTWDLIWTNDVALSWKYTFAVMLDAWTSAFIVIVGWRTAKVFGGVPVAGAIAATMFVPKFGATYLLPFISIQDTIVVDGVAQTITTGYNFLGIHILDPISNWLTIGWRPTVTQMVDDAGNTYNSFALAGYASGAIFGAMMLAFISIPITTWCKNVMPEAIEMVAASLISFVLLTMLGYFLVIPVSGIIFTIVTFLFTNLAGNAFGAGLLAFIFLWAVVFGVHQGFVPVYAALISATGMNSLIAVLAMGGAGQVGSSIGLYLKAEKGSQLRNNIRAAIIPGILGIGEPLIYGVSLIRPKAFLAAMIGAGLAGFWLGAWSSWGGITVGLNVMSGPSGILMLPLMVCTIGDGPVGNPLIASTLFAAALAIAYIGGCLSVFLIGTKGVDLS